MLTRLGLRMPGNIASDREGGNEFAQVVKLAQVAESSGFDSIWVADQADKAINPSFEAYTLLGALAVCTRTSRLGALVSDIASRNPGVLAKQVTAIDVLSSGRAVLGVGPGGEKYRHDRFEEALQVLSALVAEGTDEDRDVSFEGRFYQLDGAPNLPRPVQAGGIPIVADGTNEEMLGLVAKYADGCSFAGEVSSIRHRLSILDRHLAVCDRDPATFTRVALIPMEELVSADGSPSRVTESVADLLQMGIDGFIVDFRGDWEGTEDQERVSALHGIGAIRSAFGR